MTKSSSMTLTLTYTLENRIQPAVQIGPCRLFFNSS